MPDEDGGPPNPYAPPAERARPAPRSQILLPGWLIVAFAIASLLLPLAAIEDMPLGGVQMRMNQIVWAGSYGVPTLLAALIFGVVNLRRGREVRLSRIGVGICCVSVIALPLVLILR